MDYLKIIEKNINENRPDGVILILNLINLKCKYKEFPINKLELKRNIIIEIIYKTDYYNKLLILKK